MTNFPLERSQEAVWRMDWGGKASFKERPLEEAEIEGYLYFTHFITSLCFVFQ